MTYVSSCLNERLAYLNRGRVNIKGKLTCHGGRVRPKQQQVYLKGVNKAGSAAVYCWLKDDVWDTNSYTVPENKNGE